MCEKKIRKIARGSQQVRLREARRLQRIQRMTPSPSVRDESRPRLPQIILPIDKAVQNKVILELAWKTVALMHKNKLIQQKIIALQKETSEYVASFMTNDPENKMPYLDRLRAHAQAIAARDKATAENKENNNIIIKTEPQETPE